MQRSEPTLPQPAAFLKAAHGSWRQARAAIAVEPTLVPALLRAAALWPAVCLLLGAGFWSTTILVLGNEPLSFANRAMMARQLLTIGSVVLALLATAGAILTVRFAWRKHHADCTSRAYRLASDNADEGFCIIRMTSSAPAAAPQFIIEDCNQRAADLIGAARPALIGAETSTFEAGGAAHLSLAVLRQAAAHGRCEDEFRVSPFGQLQPTWIHRMVLRSGDRLVITLRDVTASRAHQQALARMANADALTTLPNRHWLMGFLPGVLSRARASSSMAALLVIDLDDFKNINDMLGHAAGDELLQAAAFRLRSTIRPDCSVVRLGGDEFTVVLERVDATDDVARIAARLVDALAEPFSLRDGGTHRIQASIGVSVYPRDGDEGEMLLKHADIALNAAKENGKAHFLFYEPHLSASLAGRIDRESALRRAIELDQFTVHYQPRVNALTGELCSMEALVRWHHPEQGLVSPGDFIPLAEETGLIVALGAMVVEKTGAQLAAWRAQGLPLVPVSINVSSRQFSEMDLAALFKDLMSRHALPPSLIEIELTESCMMGEDDVVIRDLRALQTLGIQMLVDDFGTGYSSLSQLQRLNFDVLKVDMSFTASLGKTEESAVFFKAIVWMAHALGMTVVAEGVETQEQLQILQAMACDEIQGFLISRPVPADAMALLMQQRMLFQACGLASVQVQPSLPTPKQGARRTELHTA